MLYLNELLLTTRKTDNCTHALEPNVQIGGSNYAPFSGQFSDLNIWDKSLSSKVFTFNYFIIVFCVNLFLSGDETRLFSECKLIMESQPAILNWEKVNITRIGSKVRRIQIDSRDICHNETELGVKNFVKLFPWLISQPMSLQLCEYLGGQMPIPSKVL